MKAAFGRFRGLFKQIEVSGELSEVRRQKCPTVAIHAECPCSSVLLSQPLTKKHILNIDVEIISLRCITEHCLMNKA